LVRPSSTRFFPTTISARPAKLSPLAAESLPQITDNGKTYTIKLRKESCSRRIRRSAAKRELVAEDVVYSLKRLADPKLRSPWVFLVEGKFVGLDEEIAAAKQGGKIRLRQEAAGPEVVDKYTLRLRPGHRLQPSLRSRPRADGDRRARSDRSMVNPTAARWRIRWLRPYRLAQWVRGSKIVLEANPEYRGFTWDFTSKDPADQKMIAQMKGKKMPQVGRVEISIIEEDQARWLAFQNRELDIMNMEGPLAPQALVDGKLKPELAAKGIRLDRIVDPEISYVYWNLTDPVVGGLSKERSRCDARWRCPTTWRRTSRSSATGRPSRRRIRSLRVS
jgi:ABC-type transport system substrate-binding protein